jgi:hypothetical protein
VRDPSNPTTRQVKATTASEHTIADDDNGEDSSDYYVVEAPVPTPDQLDFTAKALNMHELPVDEPPTAPISAQPVPTSPLPHRAADAAAPVPSVPVAPTAMIKRSGGAATFARAVVRFSSALVDVPLRVVVSLEVPCSDFVKDGALIIELSVCRKHCGWGSPCCGTCVCGCGACYDRGQCMGAGRRWLAAQYKSKRIG